VIDLNRPGGSVNCPYQTFGVWHSRPTTFVSIRVRSWLN